ncbi:MAG: hypothetical protein QOI10_4626 [Solirubrobacterales bacterium]|nr:hypothetical protein [Solirubrobacterales bacterium]MEA2716493.1 hypothetical protein [Actinomycetota bacterium]
MSDLTFEVVGVAPERYAAVPTITFRVRISETSGESIHAIALRTQIMIEPQRRRYVHEEEERLLAQFGERERWGQTLKPFLWTNVATMVSAFTESTEVDVQVPCTYDFELGSTKFLHAVETGEVPLNLLFSGTIFSKGETGFTVEPVPWNKEARFGMPSSIWPAVMDMYFPGTGWLRIPKATLDKLERFRTIRGLPSWERTFDVLVGESQEPNGLLPDTPPEAAELADVELAQAPSNGASS